MAEDTEEGIVVRGEATVRRVPDLAVVSLAVAIQDRDAGKARDEANRRASAILERLRGQGLQEADIQAPSLTVQPVYDYSRGKPRITGYEASRPMTLRIRDISLLGPILDSLVDDGATLVHGTSMELAEPEAASQEALAAAFGVARARAEALAAAANLELGQPLRIEEGMEGSVSPFPHGAMMRMAADESAPTEVAAGEIEISASVRVWFDLV
jgi:uncharacterized protein YggE